MRGIPQAVSTACPSSSPVPPLAVPR